MASGFEITSMILTSCQTESPSTVQLQGGGGFHWGNMCAACYSTAGLPGMGWLLPPPKLPPEDSEPLGTRPA